VFASPTSAPAYAYDPYGVPLQTTAPLTDFGYAGLINEPDSGLGLATYRAYDPRVGRWISRDPIGERGSAAGNLYVYVGANPVGRTDIFGLTAEAGPSGQDGNEGKSEQCDDDSTDVAINWKEACFLIQCLIGSGGDGQWKPKMPLILHRSYASNRQEP
jgi:RHS repeat-associated protein